MLEHPWHQENYRIKKLALVRLSIPNPEPFSLSIKHTSMAPSTTTTNNPPTPLPPLSALIRPDHMHRLFPGNERAAYWHRIVTELWDATTGPRAEDAIAAHRRLARLTLIAARSQAKRRAARAAARQVEEAQNPALTSKQEEPSLAVEENEGAVAGNSAAVIGPLGFVDLSAMPSQDRCCSQCSRPYRLQEERDGEARFFHYPVQLSCLHLVCFGCAKVLVRMHVNCTCGATFADGKAELARVKSQIQSCSERLDAVGTPKREDVEAALLLLNLAGKKFGKEDIDAGLALLDLQAGTDTTLEEYLLTISRF